MAGSSKRFVQAWEVLSMLALAAPLVSATPSVNPTDEINLLKRQLAEGRLHQPKTKCIAPLGCFPIDGEWSQRSVNLLPADRSAVATTFLLVTRQNRATAQQLVAGNSSTIERSNFVGSRRTKFIVHGYLSSAKEEWVQKMVEELLKEGDYNVIKVNWSGFTGSTTTYVQATANIRLVGAEIALLMKVLVQKTGANLQGFHIIGHSLGAHAAGYAGQSLKGIGRITGLDPAGPLFEGYGIGLRLDSSDASFVDVIHTDGDNLVQISQGYTGFGLMQVSGHADFYPNGGMQQPGCEGLANLGICDHQRAVELFTSSINNNCTFTLYKCSNYSDFKSAKCLLSCSSSDIISGSCNQMGFRAAKPMGIKSAVFYGYTTSNAPYCATAYVTEIEIDSRSSTKRGSVSISLKWASFASPLTPLSDGYGELKAGRKYRWVVSTATKTDNSVIAADVLWQPDTTWWQWASGCGLFGSCTRLSVTSLLIQRENSSSPAFCATGFTLTAEVRQQLNGTRSC